MEAEFKHSIKGLAELKAIFDKYPELGWAKPCAAAFKKAAVPVRRAFEQSLPPAVSTLKKAIKVKASKQGMFVNIGFYAGQGKYANRRGQQWDPYQLIYWANYGTLANRAAEHSFKTSRRKASASWQGGIRARLFLEKAIESSLAEAKRVFDDDIEKEVLKFLNKEAKKIA